SELLADFRSFLSAVVVQSLYRCFSVTVYVKSFFVKDSPDCAERIDIIGIEDRFEICLNEIASERFVIIVQEPDGLTVADYAPVYIIRIVEILLENLVRAALFAPGNDFLIWRLSVIEYPDRYDAVSS